MRWTKQLPTEPGWYWKVDAGESRPAAFQLVINFSGKLVDSDWEEPPSYWGGYWAGPIPYPLPLPTNDEGKV